MAAGGGGLSALITQEEGGQSRWEAVRMRRKSRGRADREVNKREPVARGRCHRQGNSQPACTNKHYLHCTDREPSRAEQSGAAGGPTHRKLFTLLVRERLKKKEKTCMRPQENCSVSLCDLHSGGRGVRQAGKQSDAKHKETAANRDQGVFAT